MDRGDLRFSTPSRAKFRHQLLDSDLMDLRKAGVSSRVVAVMVDSSALTQIHVTVDKKEVTLHTLGRRKLAAVSVII
jgi:hypothetical protein